MRGDRRMVPGLAVVLGVFFGSACTEEARTDLAKSAFVKTVNLKCKLSKSEAKLAWNLAGELGVDAKAREAMSSARRATDRLLAEVKSVGGPPDVTDQLTQALRSSQDIVSEVSKGSITASEGRARLASLRNNARAGGFGECVAL
jgi:hypothetical protein